MKQNIPAWWLLFAVELLANPENPAQAILGASEGILENEVEAESQRILNHPGFKEARQMAVKWAAAAYNMDYASWVTALLDVAKESPSNLEAKAKRRTLEVVGEALGYLAPRGSPPSKGTESREDDIKQGSDGTSKHPQNTKGEKMDIMNQTGGASRAITRKGRKKILNAQRVQTIVDAIAAGDSEKAARIKGGVSGGVFYREKATDPEFRQAIEDAHRRWADIRYQRHRKQVESALSQRGGHKKIKAPKPIYQASLVVWELTTRLDLGVVSISLEEEERACAKYGLPWDMWCRTRDIFNLMPKIYQKRSKLRWEKAPDKPVREVEGRYEPEEEASAGGVGNW